MTKQITIDMVATLTPDPQGGITWQDEGTVVAPAGAATTVNVVGSGVAATFTGTTLTLTFTGGGGGGTWGSITGTLSAQTDLQAALNAKAASIHTHAIADVTGLQAALDGKAALSHTHLLSAVTDVTMTVANLNSLDDGVDSTLHFHASDRARGNHTGTQLAATISDFAATVLGGVLTGFAVAGARTAIVATDTMLAAFGKVQKYLNDLAAIAFSGSAADLTAGTLATARMPAATGDVTSTVNTYAFTIPGGTVTYAKMQNVSATSRIMGRATAGAGSMEELTNTQVKTILAIANTDVSGLGALATASSVNLSTQATGTLQAAQEPAHTGDVTNTAGSLALTIAANAVTNAKAAQMAATTIKANVTGALANATDATPAQVAAILPNFVASGAGAAKGLVPAPSTTAGTTNFLREDGTWAVPAGGGGGTPGGTSGQIQFNNAGAFGGFTMSGDATITTGGVITIAAGAVTLAKQANLAANSIIGNNTGAAGVPLALTAAQVKTLLAIAAADVSGLGALATASSVNLTTQATGVLQAAQEPAHTGDVTNTAGSLALTIANGVVTYAKMQNISATARFMGRITAGAGSPEELTGTQATTLLDTFTSALKGLAPASGGGTTNFLRADGTWAAPAGGAAGNLDSLTDVVITTPSTGQLLRFDGTNWVNATVSGTGDVTGPASSVDSQIALFNSTTGKVIKTGLTSMGGNGELIFPVGASFTPPGAGALSVGSYSQALKVFPITIDQTGETSVLWPDYARDGSYGIFSNGTTALVNTGCQVSTAVGTGTAKQRASTNAYTKAMLSEFLVTVAATTAIASIRGSALTMARELGFFFACKAGPATGVATATSRFFMGLINSTAAQTDAEPSSQLNCVGFGYDAADTNCQIFHNDGTATATKIDLGVNFPVPTADRTQLYELFLYAPAGGTVVNYRVVNINTGAVATGSTATTKIPSVTAYLAPRVYTSVGGTSSVIGLGFGYMRGFDAK